MIWGAVQIVIGSAVVFAGGRAEMKMRQEGGSWKSTLVGFCIALVGGLLVLQGIALVRA